MRNVPLIAPTKRQENSPKGFRGIHDMLDKKDNYQGLVFGRLPSLLALQEVS